jgi:tetratricopeptide (TPR) repeat protein
MSLKSERELSPNAKALYTRAKQAAQSKNIDYAISLIQAVLKEEPLFLDGRQYLRGIEIQKYNGLSSISKQMLNMKVGSNVLKLSAVSKKEPAEQMAAAEEILEMDPFNVKANTVIAEAGHALELPQIAAFAYETISVGKPNDKAYLMTLAKDYMAMKQYEKAEATYERVLKIDPRDGDAMSGLKNAKAAHASRSGGWETAAQDGDFRGALKDRAESERLEQEGKVVKSAEGIEASIQTQYAKWQAEPTNPLHSRAIAQLYRDKGDYATAIVWYEEAFKAGGKIDSAIDKLIGDLKLKKVDQELNQLKTGLAEQTDPDAQAQYQVAIDQKLLELNEARVAQAEALVRAQPNEGEFRFKLGDALYKVGQYKRATEELQLSLKQPSVRHQALNLMGLCFIKRGMLDFAIKQLSLAKSELVGMDELKKEITYNLGLAYEAAKQPDKAIEQFKDIYEHDMTYRDVSQRVEASYGGGEQAA